MKVKVCGITREQDARLAAASGATHLGIILIPSSRRFVSPERAEVLRRSFAPGIRAVGVFQNQPIAQVIAIARQVGLDAIQLHGGFDPLDAKDVKAAGFCLIWAVPVDAEGRWTDPGVPEADLLLLDRKDPRSFGGTGRTFRWDAAVRPEQPFFVAGGLGPHNLVRAVDTLRPDGVDLGSVLEESPGVKSMYRLGELRRVLTLLPSFPTLENPIVSSQAGRFGPYGGAYIPETLNVPIQELTEAYNTAVEDPDFWREFDETMKAYVGRPSPITRAPRLEQAWGAKGPIYFKREDLNHTGAHKINNCVGQVLLAQRMGKKRIIAETGAGQHGVATATVCAMAGLECVVYMGEVDILRQALNVYRMRLLGAKVVPVASGSRTLKDAINEAMRDWVGSPESTFYLLGSALGPHPYPEMVRRFQSVIGTEARAQWLERFDAPPSAVVACVGGGSNAIGIFSGFIDDEQVALYGAEAGGEGVETGKHASRFAGGTPGILHGTKTYLLQTDDGQVVETHSVSAGLDYPAVGPEHAALHEAKRASYEPVNDTEALAAFHELAQLEGIFAALESSHAVALAKRLVAQGVPHERGILINLSGRGDKDVHTIAAIDGVEL